MKTIREKIAAFNYAFDRPVNSMPIQPTVSERLLLGKLLLEETIETLALGLGLRVVVDFDPRLDKHQQYVSVTHEEGCLYDPVETADGQGDVNVVNHFMAHWLGFNLDKITDHINDSNMSKLVNGEPIINGETEGYRHFNDGIVPHEPGYDPTKPIGKILKGPDFWDAKPGIPAILEEGNIL